MKFFLSLFFFTSGINSLTLQIIWSKVLSQLIGSDYYSNIFIVTIFMLGLSFGGLIGAILSHKFKRILLIFLIIEAIITIYGILSIKILRGAHQFFLEFTLFSSNNLYVFEIIIYSLIILLPITLMGASLPIITQVYQNIFKKVNIGKLYGLNIFGASIGAFLSGFFLIGTFGLYLTSVIIGIFTLIIASLLFLLILYKSKNFNFLSINKLRTSVSSDLSNINKFLFFLVGFVALGYQVIYFRLFVIYFSSTSYVFSMVLCIYLLMMGMGTYIAGITLNRFKVTNILLFSIFGILLFSPIIFITPEILNFFDINLSNFYFRTYFGSKQFIDYIFPAILFSILFMMPILFLSIIFPLLVHKFYYHKNMIGNHLGKVYFLQTMGNFFGIYVTGFIFIKYFGTINTAKLFILLILLFSFIILINLTNYKYSKLKIIYTLLALISTALVSIFLIKSESFSYLKYQTYKPKNIIEEREGMTFLYGPMLGGTSDNEDQVLFRMNLGQEPATSFKSKVNIFETGPILQILPDKPRKILIIGIGSGDHAIVLKKLFPEAEITIVEFLSSLIEEMKKNGSPELKQLIKTSNIVITDGRNFVNKYSTKVKYDYIQIGVFRTTTSGAGNLFTYEFLSKIKKILGDNGVLSFNAAAPAVKAGLKVFDNIIIYSPSEGSVADVFFSDNLNFNNLIFEEFKYKNLFIEKKTNKLNFEIPKSAFFLKDKELINYFLKDITMQTDDLVATEYFLSTNTYLIDNKEDNRHWPRLK